MRNSIRYVVYYGSLGDYEEIFSSKKLNEATAKYYDVISHIVATEPYMSAYLAKEDKFNSSRIKGYNLT